MDATEIYNEIESLEQGETTYSNCMKLSVLYIIADHMKKQQPYSLAGSEFLLACSDAPLDHVFEVLDEHMDCIKLLYPKEYNSIIKKIRIK